MSTVEATSELRPFTEQEPFLDRDKRFYGYVSGVGAGKTFAGIIRTILNMECWNPGEMGAIVAPTTTMVKDVIIAQMRDVGLLDHWEYKSTHSDSPGLHAPNGSRALILSADNRRTVERLRGLNLAWWWMDEEAIIDKRARDILTQRLRTGNYRNGYVTTTPKGKNHTYDFFVGDVDADRRDHGTGHVYTAPDRLAIVGVPTHANPHTPKDYKESVERDLPSALIAQEVQGQFVEVGSGLLTEDMLDFVAPEDMGPPERTYTWYVGVDIGVKADAEKARADDADYWAAAAIAYDGLKNVAYLVDVSRKRGLTLQQGVAWLSAVLEDIPTGRVLAEANQAQRWFVQAARDAGLRVDPVQNTAPKEDRILYMSVPFENGQVKVVDHIDWSDFVAEWLAFPDGRHDDQLDAVEIALQSVNLGGGVTALGGDAYGESDTYRGTQRKS